MLRKIINFALKFGVSGGLLYFLSRGVDLAVVGEHLSQADPFWVIMALLLLALQLILLAYRWRLITGAIDTGLGLTDAVKFSIVGQFFNQTLPSIVGGDGFRMWLASRTAMSKTGAVHSVLLDRFAGLFGLVVLSLISLPPLFRLLPEGPAKWAITALVCVGFAGTGMLILLGGPMGKGFRKWLPLRLVIDLSQDLRRIALARAVVWPLLIMSTLIHLLTVVIINFLGKAVSAPVTLEQALVVVPPMLLISSIPITIAGWGVREGVMVFALGAMGMAAADAIGLSVLYGLSLIVVGLPGGPVWLACNPKAKKRNSSIDLSTQDAPSN
ncbi:MAG: lysylphosphatidylglycerol synthase transmembrane domain-containing protein [Alphaproteobacteria bacterium]